VWAGGREVYGCHGVTSIENPLPVDVDTVFVIGSVTKTFTATAVMCLVAGGQVDLGAPVRRYVPEFTLTVSGPVRLLSGAPGQRGLISSVLYNPITDSARAL
jgi:CubicO group peptidase (beta-lactamase class C family)